LTPEIKLEEARKPGERQRGEFRSQKAMIGFFLVSWLPA
jgi:hypothetical protein